MATRDIHQWLAEYGESHQNATNKIIHWICVPAIFFSIVGLLFSIRVPIGGAPVAGPVAYAALAIVVVFYVRLSFTLTIGMTLFTILCLLLASLIHEHAPWPLWVVCVGIFVAAWIGQFYGHKVEGKKPSFFKDLQFLMIGPAWLMSFIYRRMGIAY